MSKYLTLNLFGVIFLSKNFKNLGVSTGDGIFVLGFPNGIRGKTKNYVIVKKGIIARYDEELLKEAHFFIDSSAYPGNSGGPIIYKPELVAIQNTKFISRSALIGIISEGITFQEIAISEQTGRPRIAFEEQTGIIKVVPIDFVIEAIDHYEKEKGVPKAKEKVGNDQNFI